MAHSRFSCLDDWLTWQATLHPKAIDMSLERIRTVAGRLDLLSRRAWTFTVAGTNGKGSSIAYAEAMLRSAGLRVGTYTSPHLLHYCERICIDGRMVDEASVIRAFEAIDLARGNVSLTYFEFGTLAARWLFAETGVDVELLEVGLGGRLDSVNIFEPDACLMTSVGLDHCEWLGSDREMIGREKAGIMRTEVPVVFAGPDIPDSVRRHAAEVGAALMVAGEHYRTGDDDNGTWWYEDDRGRMEGLVPPPLPGNVQRANAAGVFRALRGLPGFTPSAGLWNRSVSTIRLAGRLQRLSGSPAWWLDVAHNADSAAVLADSLQRRQTAGRRVACLAMMRRKDPAVVLAPLADLFDGWYLLALPEAEAWTPDELGSYLPPGSVLGSGPPEQLFREIGRILGPVDELVVFGSFRTVEEAMRFRGVDSLHGAVQHER